jgi:hypothetical protein
MLRREITEDLLAIKILRAETLLGFDGSRCIIESQPNIALIILLYEYLLGDAEL